MKQTRLSKRCLISIALAPAAILAGSLSAAVGHAADGFLDKQGKRLFPLGCYELPKEDAQLQAMADAGINLIRCHDKNDLDRLAAAGLMGWLPLPLAQGDGPALRKRIEEVKDHPALAVWEGPDEVVHNFTAYSGLYRKKIHQSPSAWQNQAREAVEYAEKQGTRTLKAMSDGIALVRRLDARQRPIWVNEAANSDLNYVRQYIDEVDITGCDIYPVRSSGRPLWSVADATERWKLVGRQEKPVWMVLQGFSWHELGKTYGQQKPAYPSLEDTRTMAYEAIAHGAHGILYWGTPYLTSDDFRAALYSVTRELAALQPFLVASEVEGPQVRLVELGREATDRGVALAVRRVGSEWLVVLVNEDDRAHFGVEVSGLKELEGRGLILLYGNEQAMVHRGELATRLLPLQTKVFATSRQWETQRPLSR